MSLWSNLLDTYDAIRKIKGEKFIPPYHTTMPAHLCVTIDQEGNFIKVEEANKEIIIPCTDKSQGRASGGFAPHPLCDQLQYLDRKIGNSKKVDLYLKQLESWKDDDKFLNAIYNYVSSHSITEDAELYGAPISKDGKTETSKPDKLGVRFAVMIPGESNPHVEESQKLREKWISFQEHNADNNDAQRDLFGRNLRKATMNFPKKVVKGRANAKLISANDNGVITYDGRFGQAKEALSIDSFSVQKICSALRWLVDYHGTVEGSQIFVVWAVQEPNNKLEDLTSNSYDVGESFLFEGLSETSTSTAISQEEALLKTDQDYAKLFRKYIHGFGKADSIKNHFKKVVLLILDTATVGRLSVVFYRELLESDYVESLLRWHIDMTWPLTYRTSGGNTVHYIGAPSFDDILSCAYPTSDHSSSSYQKFAAASQQRLIESMFGNSLLPQSLLNAAFHKVIRPLAYKEEIKRWRHDFEVACSLWKKQFIDEAHRRDKTQLTYEEKRKIMELDETRADRDYLFGRLLALADYFEYGVLKRQNSEKPEKTLRPTNAVGLMSNFVAKPSSTWLTLWKKLIPYIKSENGARWFQTRVDQIVMQFQSGDFENNKPLSPAFLLGYSAERRSLMKKKDSSQNAEAQE
ncbi:type I-C CRISPR-associated protein Cas8c/Csd1 [Alloscardovia venturai]|uniref:Type I-C CRISPR-associated protein Cas8c/Csd1 n=1 Tax=Alloscardovia venturai TaxID=1769421 RepID=A0ABW2Y5V4_9BIFI